MHGYMNICKDRVKFNNLIILLDIGYSCTIATRILMAKFNPRKMLWINGIHNRVLSLLILMLYYILPYLNISATKILMWNFHVDESV